MAKNAGIGVGEYPGLYTNPVLCDLLVAKRYPATSQLGYSVSCKKLDFPGV